MPSGTEVRGRELLNMTYSFPAQVSGRLALLIYCDLSLKRRSNSEGGEGVQRRSSVLTTSSGRCQWRVSVELL